MIKIDEKIPVRNVLRWEGYMDSGDEQKREKRSHLLWEARAAPWTDKSPGSTIQYLTYLQKHIFTWKKCFALLALSNDRNISYGGITA
jgi:hypothetical protein